VTEAPGPTFRVRPDGPHAAIDVVEQNAAIAALHGRGEVAREQMVAAILQEPERFAPPVLSTLAAVLFAQGERDEAVFWYQAGQLRARFDADRCADRTAGAAVAVLRQRNGASINRHAFADPERLRTIVERVVAWDRATTYAYDHRWINLHGMGAFPGVGAGGPLSRPASEWPDIAERTRAEYLRGLDEVLPPRP
jgi:hypothetical protein